MPTLPGTREASTGVPLRTASMMHVGAAFHAAGVHQHVRALDAPAHCFVRQAAEPAVVRAFGGRGPGLLAQRGVERVADVVDQDAGLVLEQPRRAHQRLG